ncbi:uncharacterized protein PADG_06436 [Paracoccidioides brasiliensis Pb18]|uniref:Aminodeoxychorismate lyase n=1 Tax=Paracoccidioides brasiliensis (strain Pb18) TaxID=502780 RepID=C1GGJ9_PARBD|nr:uncharacterized protein PADG_06436 [Paracoccidioides brasiliensis Pb18]EEH50357.1 hypothetical protein PADG_06436 [Paracoccidioides brasiliensis Pb18]
MAQSQPQQPQSQPRFQVTSTLRYDPSLPNDSNISSSYPHPRDSHYYLLSYHHARLLSAAIDFQWPAAAAALQHPNPDTCRSNLAQIFNKYIAGDPSRPWRLRILLDATGEITVEAAPIVISTPPSQPLLILPGDGCDFSTLLPESDTIDTQLPTANRNIQKIDPWILRLDTQPTTPSLFTRHKTTLRESYTTSRARAGITSLSDQTEVLIYNHTGEVMEGSITTVYFRRRRRTAAECESGESSVDDEGGGDRYYWVTPPLSSGGNAGTSRRYALAAGFCVEEVVKVGELRDGEVVWLSNGVRGFVPAVLRLE